MRSAVRLVAVAVLLGSAAIVATGFTRARWDPCSPNTVGAEGAEVSVIYQVENGELAGICFGSDDPAIYRGWEALTLITTAEQRTDIKSFAGYSDTGLDAAAYAVPVSPDSSEWAISVDLEAAVWQPAVLRFVAAHEYAHVLTLSDTHVDTGRECSHDPQSFGCLDGNRYMAAWVTRFWSSEQLQQLDDNGWHSASAAAQRCQADPSFPGLYAATNPKEDFAESFANFVFSTRTSAAARDRMNFFMRYPEIVEMRDRISARRMNDDRIWYTACGV